jgi:hypothetical protein
MKVLGSHEWLMKRKPRPVSVASSAKASSSTMATMARSRARRRASRIEMRSPSNSPIFARAAIGRGANNPCPTKRLRPTVSEV